MPIDTAVALRCAKLHVPDPRAERDALIAATALVHRLKVATRNVADFQPMGADVFNPWERIGELEPAGPGKPRRRDAPASARRRP